jgi:hypothetical protein
MPGQRDEDSYSPERPFERGPGQSGFKLSTTRPSGHLRLCHTAL